MTARDTGTDPLRFIGISATVPNVKDIAEWLGTEHAPAQCRIFGEEYRPVKLGVSVEAYEDTWFFDSMLDSRVAEVIAKYNTYLKPTLIFCRRVVLQPLCVSVCGYVVCAQCSVLCALWSVV